MKLVPKRDQLINKDASRMAVLLKGLWRNPVLGCLMGKTGQGC